MAVGSSFKLVKYVVASNYFSENGVISIEEISLSESDKNLRSISVLSISGH